MRTEAVTQAARETRWSRNILAWHELALPWNHRCLSRRCLWFSPEESEQQEQKLTRSFRTVIIDSDSLLRQRNSPVIGALIIIGPVDSGHIACRSIIEAFGWTALTRTVGEYNGNVEKKNTIELIAEDKRRTRISETDMILRSSYSCVRLQMQDVYRREITTVALLSRRRRKQQNVGQEERNRTT